MRSNNIEITYIRYLAIVAVAGIVVNCGNASAQSYPATSDGRVTTETEIFNYVGLKKLTEAEVAARLTGRFISPDPTVNQTGAPFSEWFSADGSWSSFREMRYGVSLSGKWRVYDGQLCVSIEGGSELCRDVFRSESPERLMIADLDDSPSWTKLVIVTVKRF
ncbi:hypothetical protein [Sphingomonas oligophenolica]